MLAGNAPAACPRGGEADDVTRPRLVVRGRPARATAIHHPSGARGPIWGRGPSAGEHTSAQHVFLHNDR
jgi:hypothetical protein